MKKITRKNYFVLGIVLLITIILVIFINNLIRDYKYMKAGITPLSMTLSQISINEIDIALTELNEAILIIGDAKTKENRKLERELLKKIKSENIENYVYYCNSSNDSNYLNRLNKELGKFSGRLNKTPAIIYFKNSEIVELIDSSVNELTSDDLEKLVLKYQIGK